MRTPRSNPRGFTLIELIIAITIAGILMAVGVSSYQNWIQNSRVRSAATSISQGIQLARATAIKNNTRASFDLTGPIAGLNTSADWAVCSNTVNGNANNRPCLSSDIVDQFNTTGQLRNVQVQAISGVTCLEFNGMGRRSVTTRCNLPLGTVMQLEISNPAAGTCQSASGKIRCLRITTDSSGTTRMCDPALSRASNPAGC